MEFVIIKTVLHFKLLRDRLQFQLQALYKCSTLDIKKVHS
jgi:hypothetical protein